MKRPSLHDHAPLHLQLEQALRLAIDSGELPPGTRLPATQAWASEWSVHPAHLQQALKRLALLGYLDRKPRVGTFVRQQRRVDPIAALCAYPMREERFHSLRYIFAQLETRFQSEGFLVDLFDNLHARFSDERQHGIPAAESAALIRFQRPKALIEIGFDSLRYVSMQWAYELPKVRVDSPSRGGELFLNIGQFFQKALEHLARRAIRRVAIIGRESSAAALASAHQVARKLGLEIAQSLLVEDRDPVVSLDELGRAEFGRVLPAWSRAPLGQRPGAILVVDDILMRGVARAFMEKAQAPQWEPELVVFSCKGIRHRYPRPVTRLAANLDLYAQSIVDLTLARLLQRSEPPLPITIPCEVQE